MRYIDADKLKSEFDYKHIDMNKTAAVVHHKNILEIINQQPTADVRENVRGEWKLRENQNLPMWHWYACSNCGAVIGTPTRYCSECGADMRGGQHD